MAVSPHLPIAAGVAIAVLFAGCGEPAGPVAAPGFADDAGTPIGGALPTMEKKEFASSPPPTLPLLNTPTPAATLAIPNGTYEVRLAFDFASDGASALALRLEDPGGNVIDEQEIAAAGKDFLNLHPVLPSEVRFFAQSQAAWTIGLVAVVIPIDFVQGLVLQVSEPSQTEIEHAFYPDRLEAAAGETTRITLTDYDPHAGIANLQHNVYFESLGLRTEGKTTWGEIRVLDIPALNPGEYAFKCEFHGFQGTLVVS